MQFGEQVSVSPAVAGWVWSLTFNQGYWKVSLLEAGGLE